MMKRFFSMPGLRWRGRVKEFEREVYDHWGDAIDRSVWASWLDHWVESFDAVTMTAAIHHFPHPETVVGHAFRVLKPDGRLIIAEPFFFFPILLAENLLLRIYPLNGDLRFLSQRGLRRLVERCGFQTIAQRHAAFLARYTVAQKCRVER